MKKILMTAAAICCVSAPAFAADNDEINVTINATVQEECSLEDLGTVNIGSIPIEEAPGANALLINGSKSVDVRGWVSCNYTNQMTLSAPTPLISASAAGLGQMTGSAPFTNQINYRFQAFSYGTSPAVRSLDLPTRVSRVEKPVHKLVVYKASVEQADNVGARPYAATDYTAQTTISITTI